jgi:hypothetical protein
MTGASGTVGSEESRVARVSLAGVISPESSPTQMAATMDCAPAQVAGPAWQCSACSSPEESCGVFGGDVAWMCEGAGCMWPR